GRAVPAPLRAPPARRALLAPRRVRGARARRLRARLRPRRRRPARALLLPRRPARAAAARRGRAAGRARVGAHRPRLRENATAVRAPGPGRAPLLDATRDRSARPGS